MRATVITRTAIAILGLCLAPAYNAALAQIRPMAIGVQIDPHGTQISRSGNSSSSVTFSVYNGTPTSTEFVITCSSTNWSVITSCDTDSGGELWIPVNTSASVTVYFTTGSAGTANLNLTAVRIGGGYSDTGYYIVSVSAPPAIQLSASILTFNAVQGGSAPSGQAVNVNNSGGGTLTWAAASSESWIGVSPASGSQGGSFTVTVNPSGLNAGTYNGSATVSATGASNSPQTVSVTLVITQQPDLQLSSYSLTFNAVQGESAPPGQAITPTNAGGGTLSWTASTNQTWLTVIPTAASQGAPLTVYVNQNGLIAGTYNGAVTVTAADALNSPRTVNVTLVVAPQPDLQLSDYGLTFNAVEGGSAPPGQSIMVTNSGGGSLSWTATKDQSWLTVAPTSGAQGASFTVTASPTGLAAGTYNGTVTVTAAGALNSPRIVHVSLVVAPQPDLQLSSYNLTFDAVEGGSAPAGQSITVTNSGGGSLSWTAAKDQSWITVAPTSGSQGASVTVTASPTGLAAGTYNGTVTITAAGALNSPRTVNVALVVTQQPNLQLSSYSLTFNAVQGGVAPAGQPITATNSGGGTLSWTATKNQTWITVIPTGGAQGSPLTVYVNQDGLAAGTYNGTVTVTATGALNSPRTVNVSLIVGANQLQLSPSSLTFYGEVGGSAPAAQSITVASSGGGTLSWTANETCAWLGVSPTSGSQGSTFNVTVDPTGLAATVYNCSITISAGGAQPVNAGVTLVVMPQRNLQLSGDSLMFNAVQGGSAPAGQPITVTNSGGGNLSWTATTDQSWITVAPTSGSQSASFTVAANPAGLVPGTYDGTVTVSAAGALNSPRTVDVTLTIQPPPTLQASSGGVTFNAVQGGSAPPGQSITVTNSGGGTLNWTATNNQTWIGVSPASGSQGTSFTVTVNPTGLSAGTYNGTVTVSAASALNSPRTIDVTLVVVQEGAPFVLLDTSAQPISERSLCLTIAVSQNAAYECGGLRIVKPLPATRSMNKLRIPTLMYLSETAEPNPLVPIDITLTDFAGTPTQVKVTLALASGGSATRMWTVDATWASNRTAPRRLVFSDAILRNLQTGVWDYTVSAGAVYSGGIPEKWTPAIPGKLLVVNRKSSPYGAGWNIAGLEKLFFNLQLENGRKRILWTSGDGSAHVYTQLATDTSWYTGPPINRSDMLRRNTDGTYARLLSGGDTLLFDATGLHTATVNRLGNRTDFTYMTGTEKLVSIRLPVPSGTIVPAYTFTYPNKKVVIAAPVAGTQLRNDTLSIPNSNNNQLEYIGDAAGRISFGYAANNRITQITNRLQHGTSIAYDPSSGLVNTATRVMVDVPNIVHTLVAKEGLGVATAAAVSTLSTFYDGPRLPTDVGDTTRFWLDAFGAPYKIKNAVGDSTVLYRNDPRHPALVTEIVHPNGFNEAASYTARGNLATHTQLEPYGPGTGPAVTRYEYSNSKWPDFVMRMTAPERNFTKMDYDLTTGNLAWQQDGRGEASRVVFLYYEQGNGKGLLRATKLPLTPEDEVTYDSLGNLAGTRTPKGNWSYFRKDVIGRDTLIITPVEGSQTLSTRTWFDKAGRDSVMINYGDVNEGNLIVEKSYDAENQLRSLTRSSSVGPVGAMFTHWDYDQAGRQISETQIDGNYIRTGYNEAGNAVWQRTRMGDTLHFDYDALNRLNTRITPGDTLAQTTHQFEGLNGPSWSSPAYGAGPGAPNTSYIISSDTASFVYDALGHVTHADNGAARITRTYYPGGMIETETQIIPAPGNPPYQDTTYTTRYMYDLNGRRNQLVVPDQLAPILGGVRMNTIAYDYNADTGALETVAGPLPGQSSSYFYDLAGRLETVVRPGSVTEENDFDEDGGILRRRVTAPNRLVADDSIFYDDRGKVKRVIPYAGNFTGSAYGIWNSYSLLGSLIDHEAYRPAPGWAPAEDGGAHREAYINDALGNRLKAYVPSKQDTTLYNYAGPMGMGRIASFTHLTTNGTYTRQGLTQYTYDGAGNTTNAFSMFPTSQSQYSWTRYGYGVDDKVRFADRNTCRITFDQFGQIVSCSTDSGGKLPYAEAGAFEDYRYDAFGRRVWMRIMRTPICSGCEDTGTRTIWDGEQILGEVRGWDSGASFSGLSDPYGRVLYVHGLGIDEPLQIIRLNSPQTGTASLDLVTWGGAVPMTPVANWQGIYLTGFTADGNEAPCVQPGEACNLVEWPAANENAFGLNRNLTPKYAWFGSLVNGQRGDVGTKYRRNRYYDPVTGRFTQEDPIGLAGGLNLYGFAGGDPVNFSDPFGLCKVQLFAKKIRNKKGKQTRFLHAYVVTTDLSGSSNVYRGGPAKGNADQKAEQRMEANDNTGTGMFGNIATTEQPYDEASVDWDPQARSITLVDNDESCDDYNKNFGSTLRRIEAEGINYDLLGPNSNSVAYQLLLNAGIKPPRSIGNAPGWGMRLFK